MSSNNRIVTYVRPGVVELRDFDFPKLEMEYRGKKRDCPHGPVVGIDDVQEAPEEHDECQRHSHRHRKVTLESDAQHDDATTDERQRLPTNPKMTAQILNRHVITLPVITRHSRPPIGNRSPSAMRRTVFGSGRMSWLKLGRPAR